MRVQSTRLTELGKTLGQGITRTPDDAVLEIPPRIQPVLILPAPLRAPGFDVNAPLTESAIVSVRSVQAGVSGGGVSAPFATLGPGVWRITGACIMSFAVAQNTAAFDALVLQAPSGQNLQLAQQLHIPRSGIVIPIDATVTLIEGPGWSIRTQFGVTVGGDTTTIEAALHCGRLLH